MLRMTDGYDRVAFGGVYRENWGSSIIDRGQIEWDMKLEAKGEELLDCLSRTPR